MVNQALPLRAARFLRDKALYRCVVSQGLRPRDRRRLTMLDSTRATVTVAFNHPELLDLQLEALHRFFESPPLMIVIDNSTTRALRVEMARVVEGRGGIYIRGPVNPFSAFQGSLSHASTLDWVWKKVLPATPITQVLLLDHDIFPVVSLSADALFSGAVAAGVREDRAGMWYLWPGFLRLDRAVFDTASVSFMPYRELDTGGSLWSSHYERLPAESFAFLSATEHPIGEGDFKQDSGIELIDYEWVHLVDGSGWLDGVGKLDRLGDSDSDEQNGWSVDRLIAALRQKGAPLPGG